MIRIPFKFGAHLPFLGITSNLHRFWIMAVFHLHRACYIQELFTSRLMTLHMPYTNVFPYPSQNLTPRFLYASAPICLLSPARSSYMVCTSAFPDTNTDELHVTGNEKKMHLQSKGKEKKQHNNKHRKSAVWARRLSSGSGAKESSSAQSFHCLGMASGRYTSEYPDSHLHVAHNPLLSEGGGYTASSGEYSITICYNRIKRLRREKKKKNQCWKKTYSIICDRGERWIGLMEVRQKSPVFR